MKNEQEAMDDLKREHKLEILDLGDEKLKEDLQTMLEDMEYEIAHSAEKQQQIIQSMLDKVLANYEEVFGKINGIIGNTGWVGSDDFNKNQSDLGTQQGVQNQNNNATQNPTVKPPSDSAGGTVTDKIPGDDDFNHKVEGDIMQKPNKDNRPVAELKATPTSVTLEEGKTTTISTTIRPNDAKNKTLSWKSSNDSVATVSGGTIRAIKAGSCQVTVSTTDGSGLSVSIGVTVNKKPEPPKPSQPNKPTGGGNGVPEVGDKVTFVSGSYYYDSEGKRPAGSKYRGKTVYITKINNKSWAKKKYHISTGAKIGSGDLGWLDKSQLKGYKNGTNPLGVRKSQLAWTQENGKKEIIQRKSDGAILTHLGKGDVVYKNSISENLMRWGQYSPDRMMEDIDTGFINPSEVLGDVSHPIMTLPLDDMGKVDNGTYLYVNVEGNITEDALPGFEARLKKSVPKIVTPMVSEHISKELRKSGMRRR